MMNYVKEVRSILRKVEKMDLKYPYSIIRSIMMCDVIKKDYDEKDVIILLENYFDFLFEFKEIDGLKTLTENYDLQNAFINNKDFNAIKKWIKDNIIEKKLSKDKCDYHYNNNYSQNVIEEQSDLLDVIKNIIICNDFRYGDVIFKIVDDLDLSFFFYFDNNRYKNTLVFSEYSLFNLINYFDFFLYKVDFTFKRDNEFLIQFMMTILFNQKNNYKMFYNVLQNKKLDKYDTLRYAEDFIIKRFKKGFYKTKTQYYIKIGMNTNSKIRTFERTQSKDILIQIYKATKKLSNDTIYDWFYLSFLSDKNLNSSVIAKINRMVEDIAISNPKALVKSNNIDFYENKLVDDYIFILNKNIQQNKNLISKGFTKISNIKNDYMIKLFEGTIAVNENKIYAIKIVKIKGIIYTYINFKGINIFKDRIFTKNDAIRIVEFLKYEEEWSR